MPNRHEPFGLAVLEAWAAGRPVIVTDVDGPGWLLHDGVAIMRFSVGNVAACAAHLGDLLDHPEAAAALGAAGKKKALERFTWDRHVADLHTLYQTLMEEGSHVRNGQ